MNFNLAYHSNPKRAHITVLSSTIFNREENQDYILVRSLTPQLRFSNKVNSKEIILVDSLRTPHKRLKCCHKYDSKTLSGFNGRISKNGCQLKRNKKGETLDRMSSARAKWVPQCLQLYIFPSNSIRNNFPIFSLVTLIPNPLYKILPFPSYQLSDRSISHPILTVIDRSPFFNCINGDQSISIVWYSDCVAVLFGSAPLRCFLSPFFQTELPLPPPHATTRPNQSELPAAVATNQPLYSHKTQARYDTSSLSVQD